MKYVDAGLSDVRNRHRMRASNKTRSVKGCCGIPMFRTQVVQGAVLSLRSMTIVNANSANSVRLPPTPSRGADARDANPCYFPSNGSEFKRNYFLPLKRPCLCSITVIRSCMDIDRSGRRVGPEAASVKTITHPVSPRDAHQLRRPRL